ncbi:hypothetical protein DOTSEDRAFT_144978 [Dothistroma septosporum NZE10]|uniref:Uncharacterized protein n=1 Tax=Dothistroma septosporum (strain NZE10 / CBS 128990) TaxID=675120 RepID=N1Q4H8_DOTSN|nr:hypothetical protein DOTSEDRAFT_144978 [Dothistroma septosporum NZE10]
MSRVLALQIASSKRRDQAERSETSWALQVSRRVDECLPTNWCTGAQLARMLSLSHIAYRSTTELPIVDACLTGARIFRSSRCGTLGERSID